MTVDREAPDQEGAAFPCPHKFAPVLRMVGVQPALFCMECDHGAHAIHHRPVGECSTCFEQTWNPSTLGARCINEMNAVPDRRCPGTFLPRTHP